MLGRGSTGNESGVRRLKTRRSRSGCALPFTELFMASSRCVFKFSPFEELRRASVLDRIQGLCSLVQQVCVRFLQPS